ncbi:Rid family detoxifying hydrolase [Richelia intracellularis]|nr:Rid family detoxifying hydrolase [Richelia intracellularis]
MGKKVIHTNNAPEPVGPYSQAIITAGPIIFVSGQIALDPLTGTIIGEGDVIKQTQQVMANLEAILITAGSSFTQVVKTTIFLADINDFANVNSVYKTYFDGAASPARVCIQASRLPKDALIEIDCIAEI